MHEQELILASASFQKNSIGWQFELIQRRISESIEGLFQSSPLPFPDEIGLPPDWVLKLTVWLVLLPLLIWLGWQLIALLRSFFPMRQRGQTGKTGLPSSTPPLTSAQWLAKAQTLAQQRNYREACRMLYLAAIQRLDEQQLIYHNASRTDGEYLGLLPALGNPLSYAVLFRTHEQLCFSDRDISAETFYHCQEAYQQLESLSIS